MREGRVYVNRPSLKMRAWVVGNGPSLNKVPLDRLRDECTIVCNRFDLAQTNWDPTWWVMTDVRHEDGWWNWDKLLRRKSVFLFRDQDRPVIEPMGLPNTIFLSRCKHIGGDYIPTRWHLPTPCEYGGSISYALQLAAALGRNPVYLIGCDLYRYRGPDDPDLNHFHPSYTPYKRRRSTGEEIVGPAEWARLNDRLILSHEIARDSALSMGIHIFNATVGGALEVYPRVDVDEVLSSPA